VAQRVSRRTALGLVATLSPAAALPLAGCSADALRPTPPPAPSAPTNPDAGLLASVVARIAAAFAGAPSAFRDLHAAHLRALGAAVLDADGRPDGDDAVVATETGLRDRLTDACVSATDADLARLLASMAAAVAQQLEAWR